MPRNENHLSLSILNQMQVQNALRSLSYLLKAGDSLVFYGGDLVAVVHQEDNNSVWDSGPIRTQDLAPYLIERAQS